MKVLIINFITRIIIRILCKVKIEGLNNIPKKGAYIFTTNHPGRIDGFLPVFFKRNDVIIPIARKYSQLKSYRILRWLCNGIWLDNETLDITGLRKIENTLKKNYVFCMSPGGTRDYGILKKGNNIAAHFALKLNIPILPIVFIGTEDKNIIKIKKFQRPCIRIIIGKPYKLKKNPEINVDAHQENVMNKIAVLLPYENRGQYRKV